MRVESAYVQQPPVESTKFIDKKEVNAINTAGETAEEQALFFPLPFGSGGTYSLASLRAAVDCHAKFLTVAESNLEAVNHPARVPKSIIDGLTHRISQP